MNPSKIIKNIDSYKDQNLFVVLEAFEVLQKQVRKMQSNKKTSKRATSKKLNYLRGQSELLSIIINDDQFEKLFKIKDSKEILYKFRVIKTHTDTLIKDYEGNFSSLDKNTRNDTFVLNSDLESIKGVVSKLLKGKEKSADVPLINIDDLRELVSVKKQTKVISVDVSEYNKMVSKAKKNNLSLDNLRDSVRKSQKSNKKEIIDLDFERVGRKLKDSLDDNLPSISIGNLRKKVKSSPVITSQQTKEQLGIKDDTFTDRDLETVNDYFGLDNNSIRMNLKSHKEIQIKKHTAQMFQQFLTKIHRPRNVLYPSCGLDGTPAFIFENITYVDLEKGFEGCIEIFKKIGIKAFKEDIERFNPNRLFDLIILENPVFKSKEVDRLLVKGGYIITNDEHKNAFQLFSNNRYEFVGGYYFAGYRCGYSERKDGVFEKITDVELFKKSDPTRFASLKTAYKIFKEESRNDKNIAWEDFLKIYYETPKFQVPICLFKLNPTFFVFKKK